MPPADLDLHEQKESYRHVEEMSQRFLRLILATLALGFVFARPNWVDYMTSASPPSPGLRAARENGGYIGQLSPSIVLNNGNILRSLVVLSMVSLVIATMLAGLVIFLAKPSEEFRGEYETALAYLLLRRKAKRLLRRAYIAAFIGVLLLVSAGVGFWTFYVTGGISILLYDLAVVVVGSIGMIAFSLRFLDGLKNDALKNIKSIEEKSELSIYILAGIAVVFFYRYVWYNAVSGLMAWITFTGVV